MPHRVAHFSLSAATVAQLRAMRDVKALCALVRFCIHGPRAPPAVGDEVLECAGGDRFEYRTAEVRAVLRLEGRRSLEVRWRELGDALTPEGKRARTR